MKNGLSVIFCKSSLFSFPNISLGLLLLLLTTAHSNAQENGTKNINNPSQSPESSHQGSSAFSKFILAIFLIALFGLLGLVCYYRFQVKNKDFSRNNLF